MSKSAGNFFTVREISEKFPYEVMRFFLLNGHYRSPIDFSDTLMAACQNGLERIKNCHKDAVYYMDHCKVEEETPEERALETELEGYRVQFETAMDDDFNTADAVTAVYDLVRFINTKVKGVSSRQFAQKAVKELEELLDVLGIQYAVEEDSGEDTAKIEELIAKRAEAKKAKDFATADAIRQELLEMGITIKDTREGVQWYRS